MVFFLLIVMFLTMESQSDAKITLKGNHKVKEVISPLVFSCLVNNISSDYSISELRIKTGKKILVTAKVDGKVETKKNIPGIHAKSFLDSDAGHGSLNVTIPNPRTHQSSIYYCVALAHDKKNVTKTFKSKGLKVKVKSSNVREIIDYLLHEILNLKRQLTDHPVDNGIVQCPGHVDKDRGTLRYQTVPVKFKHAFSKPPAISLWLTGEIVIGPLHIKTDYKDVTKNGFTVECFYQGADVKINGTQYHWFAFE